MSDILEQIKTEIARIRTDAQQSNIGHITAVADGVARVNGLSQAMSNEMILFPGEVYGMVFNLEEDEVGVVLLGEADHLKEGDEAHTTGRLLSVPVGKVLLGRAVDALGRPIDGKGAIDAKETYPVERIAPGILPRKSVDQPVPTGILSVDTMIPIGRGQRELIIGDRSTGKTTIATDTIINQARINREGLAGGDASFRPIYSIYVAIGQKNANIARTIALLEKHGAMEFTVVVSASAGDNPANQYIAPYAGCAMGEWFMDHGMDALIVYDDLSKHAVAYRQISLILKRPAGREAYPGDVFYLHSRLLERAARLRPEDGDGSLTALPIIETQAGDFSAYIPTNVISITDGQIYLETDLFNQGVRPAVNAGLSVSRVGSAAQTKAIKQVGGKIKLALAQYRELAAFAQFGSDLDPRTKATLDRGARIIELFKQPASAPKPMPIEVVLLWTMQNGFFDKLDVKDIVRAGASLQEYAEASLTELLGKIEAKKALDAALEADLKTAVEQWARTFS